MLNVQVPIIKIHNTTFYFLQKSIKYISKMWLIWVLLFSEVEIQIIIYDNFKHFGSKHKIKWKMVN